MTDMPMTPTSIGKKQTIAEMATFEAMPKPNAISHSGASATLGIALTVTRMRGEAGTEGLKPERM